MKFILFLLAFTSTTQAVQDVFIGKSMDYVKAKGGKIERWAGWGDGTSELSPEQLAKHIETGSQDLTIPLSFDGNGGTLYHVKLKNRDLVFFGKSKKGSTDVITDQIELKLSAGQSLGFTFCEYGICCGDATVVVFKTKAFETKDWHTDDAWKLNRQTKNFERLKTQLPCEFTGD